MANETLKTFGKNVPHSQSEKAVKGQKKNSAGGYTFVIDPLERAKRFLILGSDASYYSSAEKLTKQNAENLIKIAESEHSQALTDLVVEISTQGRAPKQSPGLFALAVLSSYGDVKAKQYAISKISQVARTGSTFLEFVSYVRQFRSFGRSLKRGIREWYEDKPVDKLAYQMVKYRNRSGYTHADVMNLARPDRSKTDPEFSALMQWVRRDEVSELTPKLVRDFEDAKTSDNLPELILNSDLSWEMLPTQALTSMDTWYALLEKNLPLGALVRQLPRLTELGILQPLGATATQVADRLTDPGEIKRSRLHPLQILVALKTYQGGRSLQGSSSWTPNQKIVDALDKAFYLAFGNVEAANKRTLIGLDVSGSMGFNQVAGLPLSAREATAALSLVITATEPETLTLGFTGRWTQERVTDLNISPRQRLDDVLRSVSDLPFGPTDCSQPMLYAMEKNLEVDTFIVMTDNETWAGNIHAHEALNQYRKKSGIRDAKLIVLAATATKFSIADPSDPLQLDIPGFDSSTPQIVSAFSRGL